MSEVTQAGEEMARRLSPAIGTTREIREALSLVHRHGVTYSRIQEQWCDEAMSDRRTKALEHREALLERRIRQLIESLPHADANDRGNGGEWRVEFGGDPRGCTVKIIPPDGWRNLANNWDGESIGWGDV